MIDSQLLTDTGSDILTDSKEAIIAKISSLLSH